MQRFHQIRPLSIGTFFLFALFLLAGCGGGNGVTSGGVIGGGGETTRNSITVSPSAPTLPPGGSVTFQVFLTGPVQGKGAYFELDQPRAGTVRIVERGLLYTAPSTPGTYQIRFFANADHSVSTTITITVTGG